MNTCCYIDPATERDCEAAAEWVIYHGHGLEDYTHACTRHVGDMLTDAHEHRIYHIAIHEPA